MRDYYTAEEIRQRMSISTLVFQGYRPFGEEALQELVRENIRRIEIVESPDQYDLSDIRTMRLVDATCHNAGVEVVAYHAYKTTFEDIDTEAQRRERVDVCRRQIDTLLELGGTFWCCHALATDETVGKSYRELAKHVEGTDAVIAVENFNRPGLQVEDRVRFLDRLDHPKVGMILDVAHEFDAEGINPMAVAGRARATINHCGRHLRHLHLQGYKDGNGHHPPMINGDEIQWREIFSTLAAMEYPGEFTFEPAGLLANTETLNYIGRAPEKLAALQEN